MSVKLDARRIKKLCKQEGLTLQALLERAGVSRTAYYSLTRKDSVLPASVRAVAGELGVAPSAILEEAPSAEWRTRALLRKAGRVLDHHPRASFENVWHTLVLLEEPPIDRLRRSLLRGRAADLH
jgi:transcriptional regulator with XRE-family HTH domain